MKAGLQTLIPQYKRDLKEPAQEISSVTEKLAGCALPFSKGEHGYGVQVLLAKPPKLPTYAMAFNLSLLLTRQDCSLCFILSIISVIH